MTKPRSPKPPRRIPQRPRRAREGVNQRSPYWRTLLATVIVGFLAGLVVALFGPALGIGSAEELQRSATWQLLMGLLGIAVTLGVLQWVFHLRFSDFRLALVSRDERPAATPGDTLAETQSRATGPPRPDPPEAWESPHRGDEPER